MSTLFESLVSSRSLVGSKPFIIRRFCTSTVTFIRMVLAYANFIAFGLTAKQPLQYSQQLWYTLYTEVLHKEGFKINPYDRCIANKIINGTKQCTISWYIDDIILFITTC